MAVKLIASDLDGTLLRNDKSISEETGKALEKAREAGIYFVPSTGRALEAVPVEVMALPGVEYVITSNGAAVYSVSGGTRIYESLVPAEAVDALLEISMPENMTSEGNSVYSIRSCERSRQIRSHRVWHRLCEKNAPSCGKHPEICERKQRTCGQF